MKLHIGRISVLAGLIGAATLVAIAMPTAAQADVRNPALGTSPGGLTLNPTAGTAATVAGFTTNSACPAGFRTAATVAVAANDGTNQELLAGAIPGTLLAAPFGGTLGFSMGAIRSVAGPAGQTYEFVVICFGSGTSSAFVHSTFVTYSADGSSWTSSPTPPGPGPSATTTALAANYTSVPQGTTITLTATVTPAAATGNVEFFDGTDSLGLSPLSGGQATKAVSSLMVGDHSVTAHFVGNASHSASTSSPVTVTITPAGTSGTETINVNVPLSEGVFTLTVSGTPVQLSEAVNAGQYFQSTGTLSPVTVSDGRLQTKPGWSVSGQVSDFTSGANSFTGSSLGWTPQVTQQNLASDVVAGPAVAPGTVPGLKGGSGLASAAATTGVGTAILGALLELRIPLTTAVGSYSALLTVTAVNSA